MIRKLIVGILASVAVILAVIKPQAEQPRASKAPADYLGRSYKNPDNWQAQSQKKEGPQRWLCPPFCAPPEMEVASVQQKGRWHRE